jgi:opacity protein-like surface antigen
MISRRWVYIFAALGLVIATLGPASPAMGQDADFLFKRPVITIGLRVGYAVPRVGSEIFDFTRESLTVDKSDFYAPYFGVELGIRVNERVDVALGLGFERSDTHSELREWLDENGTPDDFSDDLPIEQTTQFLRVPVTVSVKAYLWDRGRSISRFAWIPESWSPYLTAGAGFVYYQFEQFGDFVHFQTLDIIYDEFETSGTSPLVHLGTGLDFSLSPRWLFSSEARYSWANDRMGSQFVGFDDIDLAGFRVTAGFSARY